MLQFKELNKINSSTETTYLVIGANGLIGRALVNLLETLNSNVYVTSRRAWPPGGKGIFFDLTNNPSKILGESWIQEIIERGRMIVFICAAITKISDCEQDPTKSYLVNVTNTSELGKQLMLSGAEVVFISTNAVFSGLEPFPTESTKHNPSTNYGRQKAEAESRLITANNSIPSSPPLMIVRLTKVIAKDNPLINGWIENLRSGKQIGAFENRLLSPISVEYTARKLVEIAQRGVAGIYHLSGAEDLSYYSFARLLASALGANPDLVNSVEASRSIPGIEHGYSSLGTTIVGRSINLEAERSEMVIKALVS